MTIFILLASRIKENCRFCVEISESNNEVYMIIIGIDPDTKASGLAVYIKGNLHQLSSMPLIDIYDWLDINTPRKGYSDIEIHIEDVNGISSNAFSIKSRDPIGVKLKKAEHVGKCKQVQIEIERIAEHFGIKVVKHRVSSSWKDQAGKQAFGKITGWTGRSNEDARSAAYFGYLGVTGQSRLSKTK